MKLGRREKTETRETEDFLEETEEWVPLVRRDCLVILACPEYRHLQGHLGKEVREAQREVRAYLEPQALLEILESLVSGDLQAIPVKVDVLAILEEWVSREKRERKARMAHQDSRVIVDLRDEVESQGGKDHQGVKETQVEEGIMEIKVKRERGATKEVWDLPDNQGQREALAHLD